LGRCDRSFRCRFSFRLITGLPVDVGQIELGSSQKSLKSAAHSQINRCPQLFDGIRIAILRKRDAGGGNERLCFFYILLA